jgi:hypothetical protein
MTTAAIMMAMMDSVEMSDEDERTDGSCKRYSDRYEYEQLNHILLL